MANILDLWASSCIVFACSLATSFAPVENIPAKELTGNAIIPISFTPIPMAIFLMVYRLYSDATPHAQIISRRDRVIKAFNTFVALPKNDATDFLGQLHEWDWAYLKGACRIIEGELLGQEKRTRVNVTRSNSQKFTASLQVAPTSRACSGEAAPAVANADLIAAMRTEIQALKKDVQLSIRGEVEAVVRDFQKDIEVEVPGTPKSFC